MSERPRSPSGARVTLVLARREIVAFARRPARIAAAVGTAVVLWLFAGAGFGGSFAPRGAEASGYASYLLPGMITLVAVFAAIFSSISVIEERQSGWLQSVIGSPAPRWSIAAGKTLGGAAVAWIQAALLLAAIPFVGAAPSFMAVVTSALALAVTCVALAALGLAFAWRSATTAGFHAVMNLVFLPMWLLSGAFFPADAAPPWLAAIMSIDPLAWCAAAIRAPLERGEVEPVNLALAILFAAMSFAAAAYVVGRAEDR